MKVKGKGNGREMMYVCVVDHIELGEQLFALILSSDFLSQFAQHIIPQRSFIRP